jgi:hypothetical protein
VELYNFTLISGTDCLVECASGESDFQCNVLVVRMIV